MYAEAPMALAKAIMTKARPTMAGLKMFIPSPPKMILPMPMATTDARTPTYHGAVPGRERAMIMPVTMAEKSPRVGALLLIFTNTNSAAAQAAMQITSWVTAYMRNT